MKSRKRNYASLSEAWVEERTMAHGMAAADEFIKTNPFTLAPPQNSCFLIAAELRHYLWLTIYRGSDL